MVNRRFAAVSARLVPLQHDTKTIGYRLPVISYSVTVQSSRVWKSPKAALSV